MIEPARGGRGERTVGSGDDAVSTQRGRGGLGVWTGTALYVGGMGSRKQNFYNQLAQRMGYEKEAAEIQDKYLSGDKAGAGAAVPQQLIDSTTLLGSVGRMADRMGAYAAAGVTTLTLAPAGFTLDERLASLRAGTEALERAGLA